MKRLYLRKFNDIVFKIAKKQSSIEYRTIMKYSKYINKLTIETEEELDNIKLEYADKVMEGTNPNNGSKYEYNIVPATKEGKYNKAIRDFYDEEVDISSELPGYGLFIQEIQKLEKEEIIKMNTKEVGDKIVEYPEFDYTDQLIIDELMDVKLS